MGWGFAPVCRDGGWQAVSETSQHGDCDRMKVSCGKIVNDVGKVMPAHLKVTGEGLTKVLVKSV